MLDGSRSSCAWDNDPDALQPGIFGPRHLPSLERRDYVTNSNDSYWLANPAHPLEGFARIIGDERTPRALRTRLGLTMVAQRLAGTDGRKGKGFTLADLQAMVFNDRQYAGELWRDDLVAMCKANPILPGSSGPVDVSGACPVLERWDRHDNLDSRGAVSVSAPAFSTPFSATDPVNTPRGLNTNDPAVRQALADAVSDLTASKIPLDAPLRGYQYEARGKTKIPIHGGPGTLGVFNAINVRWTPPAGYPAVPHGSSFVMAVSFTDGCPRSRSILTYSQSTNVRSPYYGDQTRMFSGKRWNDMRFCESALARDPQLRVYDLRPGGLRRCTAALKGRYVTCARRRSG